MIVSPFVIFGTVATMIWACFSPVAASWAFIVIFIVAFEGYTILLYRSDRRTPVDALSPPYFFAPDEADVVKRYYFFFRSPGLAREWSSALSMIQLSAFVWVPWLLYREAWIPAAVIAINYFAIGPISLKLNPVHFLQKGLSDPGSSAPAAVELESVRGIIEKIESARRAA